MAIEVNRRYLTLSANINRNVSTHICDGCRPPLQKRMIVRARTVVTMAGPPIENGAVEISEDRITAVGAFNQIARSGNGEVLDLGEQILLPGLINAHCHLDYTSLRGRIPPNESFTDWIRAINTEKTKLSPKDYLTSIEDGLIEAAQWGTTSIINFEAFPELAAQARSPLRLWWLGELIDVRAPESASDLVDSAVQSLNPTVRWGLAPHALFTASQSLYRKCAEIGTGKNVVLSTHLGESQEEMQLFRSGDGPLFDFLKSIGRNVADCGGITPLARFLEIVNANNPNELWRWLVVHLNELADSDFAGLKELKPKFHLVYCPRSHRYFRHQTFPYQRLRDLGFNICLGTDSLASNDNLNLFEEMRLFRELHPGISCREILEMVTLNPARALRQEELLGRIQPGSYADLIAIADSRGTDVFESIVAYPGVVSWSMIGGLDLER